MRASVPHPRSFPAPAARPAGVARAVLLLASVLLGCGTRPPARRDRADLTHARHFTTDIARGADLALYGDGRASLWIGHIGGGSTLVGTWSETDTWIHVRFVTTQVMRGPYFEAAEHHQPPAELLLRKGPGDTWREAERTFFTFAGRPPAYERDWHFVRRYRVSAREREQDLRVRNAGEAVEEIEILEEVDEEDDAPAEAGRK
ncbi:MAG: hypothetical protein P1V36_01285 [Planctomycetota bacterium]|nr:hypothetical protein [Planctomycetota bacterium]